MAKVRQDAWSHEDDLLLAETVLRHIREGSTQLNAFEEVGDHLNRTSAACGFRWNAEIRKKYVDAIELAKRQRKEKKRAMQANKPTIKHQQTYTLPAPTASQVMTNESLQESHLETVAQTDSQLTLDSVIYFLSELKNDYYASNQSKAILEQTKSENIRLREQVTHLEKQLKQTETQLVTIQEDYQAFIQIMERARRMTVFEGQESMRTPMFRMDKNGNLEQIADGAN
ncbi:RsfA family transcriptional regulator [Virgibacillus soli]|uniref:RsfA family transcriptional regulator n=1 Tax=Paracerasibacillus soli TaxID=480284 RepID=A0ABU5CQB4_9BACI|nr:RsfA family transcriptional regulator [Virgibacillus soli]MDY0408553.1 RsfA family transcriptional regulator [Virgibacillus soli]